MLKEIGDAIDITVRLAVAIPIGILWMAGAMALISWNNMHGKDTFESDVM